MGDADDEDDVEYQGLYENGHWEWCPSANCLVFKSNFGERNIFSPSRIAFVGSMDFKDDLDIIEQLRFRRRFQRKICDDDVVILQDVKDIVLYTAPKSLVSTTIIKIMHIPSTDRFLRALISYCQYYLQIADEMSHRMIELQVKVRTPRTDEIEQEFRENLEDLRLLLAKEYCSIILGANEYSKYHHMGVSKKMRSLSKREAIQFESILRISTQIVWLALGRKSYNQIELEINRLFKSDIYNVVEHKLKTRYQESLTATEKLTLFGSCLKHNTMLSGDSPLINETTCNNKNYNYKLLALGQIKYEKLEPRLRYLENLLILPETLITPMAMSIGILGLSQRQFDTMLKPVVIPDARSSTSSVKSQQSRVGVPSSMKPVSKKSLVEELAKRKLYEDMFMPEKEEDYNEIPDQFPFPEIQLQSPCHMEQQKKWLMYISRIKKQASKTRNITYDI